VIAIIVTIIPPIAVSWAGIVTRIIAAIVIVVETPIDTRSGTTVIVAVIVSILTAVSAARVSLRRRQATCVSP
jgi:hypothetical protein